MKAYVIIKLVALKKIQFTTEDTKVKHTNITTICKDS